MEKLLMLKEFLVNNWIAILAFIGGFIVFLRAIANYKVRMARLTPDAQDDQEAKLFRSKVQVFIQLLKDLFLPNKKKDKDEQA